MYAQARVCPRLSVRGVDERAKPEADRLPRYAPPQLARIDRWVLQQALAWLKALPNADAIRALSINLSGHSIGDRAEAPHEANLFDIQAKYADVVSLEEALAYVARIPDRAAVEQWLQAGRVEPADLHAAHPERYARARRTGGAAGFDVA